jgi:hypothetical protein
VYRTIINCTYRTHMKKLIKHKDNFTFFYVSVLPYVVFSLLLEGFRLNLIYKEFTEYFQPSLILKSFVLWDIAPYSPKKVNRGFVGIYRLHLHGQNKVKHKGNILPCSLLEVCDVILFTA